MGPAHMGVVMTSTYPHHPQHPYPRCAAAARRVVTVGATHPGGSIPTPQPPSAASHAASSNIMPARAAGCVYSGWDDVVVGGMLYI